MCLFLFKLTADGLWLGKVEDFLHLKRRIAYFELKLGEVETVYGGGAVRF